MNRTIYISAAFAFFIATNSFSQEHFLLNDSASSITTNAINIGEVIISSLRFDRQLKDLPAPMSVVGAYEAQRQSAFTISNILDKQAGISMGGDGIWATNINIRGMGEGRLVTLIDGNRVETATDLTAALSMIDVWDISRVEVIKGAQSSLYGTGAMGGIVNIITREGQFGEKTYLSGNVGSGFASANKLLSGHAEFNAGSKLWYARVSGTYTDAGNMKTPAGLLPNSQYAYNNVSARAGIKPFNNHLFRIQYQRYMANDVGIPGGDAFPGPAEATYTNISRDLIAASYEIQDLTDKLISLKLGYFLQDIFREVSLHPNTVTETPLPNGNIQRTSPQLFTPVGHHFTNGGQIQGTWKLSGRNTFIAGVDLWSRKLTTERIKYITFEILDTSGRVIRTNNIERGETPIPESAFSSAGFFAEDEWKFFDDRLLFIAGGRADGIWITNEEGYDVDYVIINDIRNDAPEKRITFAGGRENSLSWSANAGLLFRVNKTSDITLNVARSFRAPSLEERYKYIDLGNFVRIGDPSLEPERGYSADLGFRRWNKRSGLQANIFANSLRNLIVELPGEFIYTLITGASGSVTDSIDAFITSNVSEALLYGIEFNAEYNVYSNFVIYSSGSYIHGEDTETGEALPLIPPLSGKLGLRYTYPNVGGMALIVSGASKQKRIAEGEQETDGYVRTDFALNTVRINLGSTAGLQFFAGIDNILDKSYTNHLSTNRGNITVEPGRNFYARLIVSF